jgi:hypothetical protein
VALEGTEGAPFGPFRPRNTGQIHARSVARTLFKPRCSKEPRAFCALTASSALPIASNRASRVRALALRNSDLSLANASLMGLRSGEYAGR